MKSRIVSSTLLALFGFSLAIPAHADQFVINTGVDNAPYEFLPTLVREGYTTLYVFDESNFHDFETYIQFDIPAGLLPENHQVVSATFSICYCFDYTAFGDTSQVAATVNIWEISESWDPNLLTWSNRPAATTQVAEVTGILDIGPMLFDITPLAQGWLDGTTPNYGFAMKSPTARVIGMHSFESTAAAPLKATLLIETAEIPAVPVLGPALTGVLTLLLGGFGAYRLARQGARSA